MYTLIDLPRRRACGYPSCIGTAADDVRCRLIKTLVRIRITYTGLWVFYNKVTRSRRFRGRPPRWWCARRNEEHIRASIHSTAVNERADFGICIKTRPGSSEGLKFRRRLPLYFKGLGGRGRVDFPARVLLYCSTIYSAGRREAADAGSRFPVRVNRNGANLAFNTQICIYELQKSTRGGKGRKTVHGDCIIINNTIIYTHVYAFTSWIWLFVVVYIK